MAEQLVRIGVVVATWEDTVHVLACLDSLLSLEGVGESVSLKVVICDDSSSAVVFDALRTGIEARAGQVQLVQAPERGGYAAAINRGYGELRAWEPDYVLVLNNDVRLDPGALLALLESAREEPDVQVWGSSVVAGIEGLTLQCAGGCRYSPLTTRIDPVHAGQPLDRLDSLEPEPLDYVFGAAMFFPAHVVESLGSFCEDYFLYFEEQDCVKRLPQPARLGWCRDSLVYHIGGASSGSGARTRSPMQQYYENLSTLRFTRKFYPQLLPLVFVSRLLLKPVLFALRGEWQLYSPFALALLDYLLGKPARHFS